jgi:hypothetical protein
MEALSPNSVLHNYPNLCGVFILAIQVLRAFETSSFALANDALLALNSFASVQNDRVLDL